MYHLEQKERVGVYNFGAALEDADERNLNHAILVMLQHSPNYAPIAHKLVIVFFNVLDKIAYSEALLPQRIASILQASVLRDNTIAEGLYFVILPEEPNVAVALILELHRRSHYQRWPHIIRVRKWYDQGRPQRAYEFIPLEDLYHGYIEEA